MCAYNKYLLYKFPWSGIISLKGIGIYNFVSYFQTTLHNNGTNLYFNQLSIRVPVSYTMCLFSIILPRFIGEKMMSCYINLPFLYFERSLALVYFFSAIYISFSVNSLLISFKEHSISWALHYFLYKLGARYDLNILTIHLFWICSLMCSDKYIHSCSHQHNQHIGHFHHSKSSLRAHL